MKRLLFLFTFLILFVASQVFAEEWEVIETPFVTIGSVPMDEEHVQIFDDIIVEFLDGAWETEKTFPDGDSYVQKLEGIKLVRIDALPNNVERYVTYLTFEVRRYSKEYAQYTEEFILQPLYLDVDKITKKLVRATAFETIEMSNILLKKGI